MHHCTQQAWALRCGHVGSKECAASCLHAVHGGAGARRSAHAAHRRWRPPHSSASPASRRWPAAATPPVSRMRLPRARARSLHPAAPHSQAPGGICGGGRSSDAGGMLAAALAAPIAAARAARWSGRAPGARLQEDAGEQPGAHGAEACEGFWQEDAADGDRVARLGAARELAAQVHGQRPRRRALRHLRPRARTHVAQALHPQLEPMAGVARPLAALGRHTHCMTAAPCRLTLVRVNPHAGA